MATLFRISMTQAEYSAYIAIPANIVPSNYQIFITDAPVGAPNLYTGVGTNTPVSGTSGGGAGGFNNFTATTAPTATDDSADGYTVGSRWIDTVGDESYICVDATLNNAVWSKSTVGTIAEVSGLQTALDAKSATTHAHTGTYEPVNANIQSHVTATHAPSTAEQNVNADWNAVSGDAQILNKPTIPTQTTVENVLTSTSTTNALSAAQGKILQDAKQATLVSGTSVKTVNGTSLLGSGNITTSADLDGGTNTTVTNEGLATTGTPTIDTTTVPGETIIRWTGAGSFTVPLGVTSVRALVVGSGGGGGGGESNSFGGAGGGGAGGRVRDILGHVVAPSAVLTVTVPTGGSGGTSAVGDTSTSGATGASSVFGSLTAEGGGGGHGDANSPADTGYNGGGGSGDNGGGGLAGGIGSGGFAGGAGHASGRGGGGGGGAGAVGEAANTDGVRQGGDGGLGVDSDITGAILRYGSGAGGAANSNGGSVAGGTGDSGAGDGDTSAPNNTGAGTLGSAGVANRGGGGGGGCGRNGFAGGAGVVIVRFATQSRTYKALQAYANNAAAVAAGRLVGQFFNNTTTGGIAQVV